MWGYRRRTPLLTTAVVAGVSSAAAKRQVNQMEHATAQNQALQRSDAQRQQEEARYKEERAAWEREKAEQKAKEERLAWEREMERREDERARVGAAGIVAGSAAVNPGEKLAGYCPKCGNGFVHGANFCVKCGNKLA